jgi:hypothetical protein
MSVFGQLASLMIRPEKDAGFEDTFASRFGAVPLSAEEAAAMRLQRGNIRRQGEGAPRAERVMGALADLSKSLGEPVTRITDYSRSRVGTQAPVTEEDVFRQDLASRNIGKGVAQAGAYGLPVKNPLAAVPSQFNLRGGQLGVFAGASAKTADHAALAKAQEMAKNGAYGDEIWDATGWFQGADKKWRFEIPDLPSKMTGSLETAASRSGVGDSTVGQAFHHPELYAAYPQLRDVTMTTSPGRSGAAFQRGDVPSGIPANIDIGGGARNPRSLMLHELQHGIQDIEGFAKGGNNIWLQANTPAWDIYQARLKAVRTPKSEVELREAGVLGDNYTYADYLREHKQALKADVFGLDRMAQQSAADEYYKRLAGEVEARAVQSRADKPLQELRDIPPVFSEDVPRDKQFVRWLGSLADQSNYRQ